MKRDGFRIVKRVPNTRYHVARHVQIELELNEKHGEENVDWFVEDDWHGQQSYMVFCVRVADGN